MDESTVYLMPRSVRCPHCGVHHDVADLAIAFASVNNFGPTPATVVCSSCSGVLTPADLGRYCGKITHVGTMTGVERDATE